MKRLAMIDRSCAAIDSSGYRARESLAISAGLRIIYLPLDSCGVDSWFSITRGFPKSICAFKAPFSKPAFIGFRRRSLLPTRDSEILKSSRASRDYVGGELSSTTEESHRDFSVSMSGIEPLRLYFEEIRRRSS